MKSPFRIAALALAGLLLTGCESGPFDDQAAQALIDSLQARLEWRTSLGRPRRVLCGEKKGLWTIDQQDGGTPIARLEAPGRALPFGDDVRMGDHRFTDPYVQLHGDFNVKVKKLVKMTDENASTKTVEANVGVIVKHECFKKPLPLLGIDRGDFSQDAAPRIRLRQHNGWTVDQILH
jgi:hypothetical protein